MFNLLLMISNYFHDLSVAVLISNIMVIYILGKFLEKNTDKELILAKTFRKLSKITYIALAYVLAGGALRAYYFVDFEWHPAVGKEQITALVIKHIILIVLTILGIIVHIRYVKRYGQVEKE